MKFKLANLFLLTAVVAVAALAIAVTLDWNRKRAIASQFIREHGELTKVKGGLELKFNDTLTLETEELEKLEFLNEEFFLIDFTATAISDAEIQHLKNLKCHRLDLRQTHVSDSGIFELRRLLPNSRIFGLGNSKD